ncbi:RagB/SusD family nutrient uptake outer membrane protein [Sediminibacterium ginsengisoli]|uniref:Starch-binding associating with outer membrane n=1 Tax=Sediminibacterium ginsengisoli TaxID=413434 RepID=A0A1T4K2Y2_9BACT|nr:RagB/SusD family nutrient uptake outer membrane protein [Sediminibacterium ginsengisoli]SJZ36637.1 Starch-binding associating with outer membrane [Sediminibacterium ginsengisoli]
MKKKYFYKLTFIAGAGLLLLLGGCKKFLDQQPITEVSAEMVFKDVPSTYKAIAGVYSRLVGDAGFGIRLSLYYTVDTDEMQGPTGASDNDRRDIARYIATSTNAQLTNPFNQLFTGIEYANICIANIPKMAMYNNGSEQEKKQLRRMYGEALALRAQYYFQAIVNWGDVPAHFNPASVDAATNPFPVRTDRDTIYNRLLEDLKTAADLVPWRNEVAGIGDQIDERLTKGSIKALRARIALFRGGYALRKDGTMKRGSDYQTYYQIARQECSEIIASAQHSLNPSYKALWKDQVNARAVADPNGELMFQASGIGASGAEDTKLAYYNGPTVGSFGNKSINVLPNYFYLFDSTDQRRDVTCAVYNVAADGATKVGQAITAIVDGKYRRDWITNPVVAPTNAVQYFGLKWQILRYSDVLLMYAEAENELNPAPTAAAFNAVNQVRRRGYGKPINTPDATVDLPSTLDKNAFFTAIVKERSLELGGEGVRKFDLIRWNMLAAKIAETKATLLAMSNLSAPYNTLPIAMYYKNNSTADDATLWANSFYKTAPTATPAGTTKVTWFSAAINTTALSRYATGFTTGKSELNPIPQPARDANFNLSQNPGY